MAWGSTTQPWGTGTTHWVQAEVLLQEMSRAEIMLLLCIFAFPISPASAKERAET